MPKKILTIVSSPVIAQRVFSIRPEWAYENQHNQEQYAKAVAWLRRLKPSKWIMDQGPRRLHNGR